VIVHINHIAPSKKKTAGRSPVSQLAGLVNCTMLSMVEDGVLDPRLAPSLRVHLDWIQYKTNFREPVMVRARPTAPAVRCRSRRSRFDLRQTSTERLSHDLARAVRSLADAPDANPQQHVFPRRLHTVPGLPDLGLQPSVLASPVRLGGRIGPGVRGRAAGRIVGRQPSGRGGRVGA
jgi:hypothetical protein